MQLGVNVEGLYWRFTAIGQMKFEALPLELRQRLLPNIWELANSSLPGLAGLEYQSSPLRASGLWCLGLQPSFPVR